MATPSTDRTNPRRSTLSRRSFLSLLDDILRTPTGIPLYNLDDEYTRDRSGHKPGTEREG